PPAPARRARPGRRFRRSSPLPSACVPSSVGLWGPLQPHWRRQRNVESPPRAAMIAGRMRREGTFRLRADFVPEGDQPQAIAALTEGVREGAPHQVLLGVTGSGKTFTASHVMANLNKPTLVIAPNKTLAAQLYHEFRTLFPGNAGRYFVSYYDYYQPEAYVPSTDTYIEKDASINDEIDKMRHAATKALLERNDALVVASVSCIYGLGSPASYFDMLVFLDRETRVERDVMLRKLVDMQYQRSDYDFHRGTFRVRGDVVAVFPAYEAGRAIRPDIVTHSRPLCGRRPGQPPYRPLVYFPDDYLLVIDESHVTVSQIGGMYRGDRSRKETLVEFGFRLPSALDNRPLNFEEFTRHVRQRIYVSATPGEWEIRQARGRVVEQLIRPTGLTDPAVVVRPARHQVDDLLEELRKRVAAQERVLVTTLTKKMAEDLTDYLQEVGIRVRYIHSDIETIERVDIIRDLRRGEFDVLVGINLLREGLDLPEVSLVAILDADKEGYLRSERSLIQTIGRAARNVNGTVLMYADVVTDSMRRAIGETNRRRAAQEEYNRTHGITPQTIKKAIAEPLAAVCEADYLTVPAAEEEDELAALAPAELAQRVAALRQEMREAAKQLEFERAAEIRDRIKTLEARALGVAPADAG